MNFFKSVAFLALIGLSAAVPADKPGKLVKKQTAVATSTSSATFPLTTNARCGPNFGTRCHPGDCCSPAGWCGSTSAHCGTGCQIAYGVCSAVTSSTSGSTATSSSAASTTSSATFPVTTNARCGPNFGTRCHPGDCCSPSGWCGSTSAHCGTGCQIAYGTCSAVSSSSTKTSSTQSSSTSTATSSGAFPVSTNGRCGPSWGNTRCPGTDCCSESSWCGPDGPYCRSPGCQRNYGRCDADRVPAGDSTRDVPRPKVGNVPYGQIITSCESGSRQIALTYDDGPFLYTNEMLDLLAAYNFKATFFVSGVNLAKGQIDDESTLWPSMIRRALNEGHQIAHHSWSHADLDATTGLRREEEIIKNEMALRNVMGKFPTYLRPPYGICGPACLSVMNTFGYHVVNFDMDTNDWRYTTPQTQQTAKDIVKGFLDSTTVPDYLSLFHDIHWQTVHNLSVYTFDLMVANNWQSTTVGACLNDPPENWYRTP